MTIPAGFAQINLRWGGAALPTGGESTFGIQITTSATPTEIGQYINDRVILRLSPVNVQELRYLGCRVKQGPDLTGSFAEVPTLSVGALAQAVVSPAVAALITKVTMRGGREGRGRMFYPGTSETKIGPGGVLDAEWRSGLEDAWQALLADLSAGGLPMMLLHKSNTAPAAVVDLTVSPTAATQRRRQRR